jgi:hypothetical protein
MRFPLSMTAGMARYIFKNKMHPRPEWQKTTAAGPDAANPFRILPARLATGESREPHPMINKRFPIVLMLEPLHACNLTCTGCGRIREYESTITERIPLEECLAAVDECGAPMVSICGGEPMMYPQIGPLVAGILERNKNIYLCTNGMFIVKRLHEFTPDKRFWRRRTICAWKKRACFARPSKASEPPRRPASWCAPTRRSTKKQT